MIVPEPEVVRLRTTSSENCAFTCVFALIVNWHVVEEEVQVPATAVEPVIVHPVKVIPLVGLSVKVTVEPDVYAEEQIGLSAPPQLLILGVASPEFTAPVPVEAESMETFKATPV